MSPCHMSHVTRHTSRHQALGDCGTVAALRLSLVEGVVGSFKNCVEGVVIALNSATPILTVTRTRYVPTSSMIVETARAAVPPPRWPARGPCRAIR